MIPTRWRNARAVVRLTLIFSEALRMASRSRIASAWDDWGTIWLFFMVRYEN